MIGFLGVLFGFYSGFSEKKFYGPGRAAVEVEVVGLRAALGFVGEGGGVGACAFPVFGRSKIMFGIRAFKEWPEW